MTPKEELMEESALLLTLESTASNHTGPLGRGWARYFRKWRDVNDDLIDLPDADFKTALGEEIRLLKAMQESIRPLVTGDVAPSGRFWRDMLAFEILETEKLKR